MVNLVQAACKLQFVKLYNIIRSFFEFSDVKINDAMTISSNHCTCIVE